MAKKLYRTIIRFEILSEEPIAPGSLPSLTEIDEETNGGSWSGQFLDDEKRNEVLEGKAAADAVKAQASSPEFFQMDDEGNDLEEDYDGQDRESYTDDQDRESYSMEE